MRITPQLRVRSLKGAHLLALLGLGMCLMSAPALAEEQDAAASLSAVTAENQAKTAAPAPKEVQEQAEAQPEPDENGFYVGGPVYVSDNINIWTRSGPSNEYRLNGKRKIGERLTFVRYSENGRYAQLEADGTRFWMPLDNLQPEMCGEPLAQMLREQISALQHELASHDQDFTQSLKKSQSEVERLSRENAELKASLATKDQTISELDTLARDYAERLDTHDSDLQLRWWLQGAAIVICGAVIGAIFVYLPKPKRKRRERY